MDPQPPLFGYPLRSDLPTLAEILRDHGYTTIGVSGNSGPVSQEVGLGLDRGFHAYRSIPGGDCTFAQWSPWSRLPSAVRAAVLPGWLYSCEVRYRRAKVITDEAIAFVERVEGDSFFLFVNYMDAHLPYSPPQDFRRSFLPDDVDASTVNFPVVSTDTKLSEGKRFRVNALYDAELRYLDSELARLLRYLQEQSAWDDMLVVITSDHGEALGEHGLIGHTSSLYDVMIRVPMVLKIGGGGLSDVPPPGSRWNRPMQLVDIAPLVLNRAQITGFGFDGRLPHQPIGPLRSWSFPSRTQIRADARFRRELRSVETEGWKLIEDDAGRFELYDLNGDPEELMDTANAYPELVDRLRALLGARTVYRTEFLGDERELSEDALQRLRALGYVR